MRPPHVYKNPRESIRKSQQTQRDFSNTISNPMELGLGQTQNFSKTSPQKLRLASPDIEKGRYSSPKRR